MTNKNIFPADTFCLNAANHLHISSFDLSATPKFKSPKEGPGVINFVHSLFFYSNLHSKNGLFVMYFFQC